MYRIRDVTSGVPRKACWGEFSIAIYGNIAFHCVLMGKVYSPELLKFKVLTTQLEAVEVSTVQALRLRANPWRLHGAKHQRIRPTVT